MKFSKKNAYKVGWEGWTGWAYNDREDFANASVLYIEVTKAHGRIKTTLSDRVYFVLDGKGEFDIDGKKFKVGKEDVVIVPKNTPYDYKAIGGVLKLFLIHVPAYDSEYEIKLEGK